jgi:hypothetical protein
MNRPTGTDFVAGITLGTSSDLDTCAMTWHKEGATNPRSGSTPWARLNNKTWASGGGAAGDECKTCHGIWGSWRGNVLVDHAAGNPRVLTTMGADLLAEAAKQDRRQLDEALFLEVFSRHPRRPGKGRKPAA